jgi:hypothetical protein
MGGETSKLGGSIYIVRCAQLRIDQAALIERSRRTMEERRGGGRQTILLARGTEEGMEPDDPSVLAQRAALPQKKVKVEAQVEH